MIHQGIRSNCSKQVSNQVSRSRRGLGLLVGHAGTRNDDSAGVATLATAVESRGLAADVVQPQAGKTSTPQVACSDRTLTDALSHASVEIKPIDQTVRRFSSRSSAVFRDSSDRILATGRMWLTSGT